LVMGIVNSVPFRMRTTPGADVESQTASAQ
jgi:hypothetical protein